MKGRIALFAWVVLMSSCAVASTELRGGDWPSNALGRNEGAAATQTSPYQAELSTAEGEALDAWADAVDRALLGGGDRHAPGAPKYERFNWVFLVIAFAGLTALFAGRRTGGRGLISV